MSTESRGSVKTAYRDGAALAGEAIRVLSAGKSNNTISTDHSSDSCMRVIVRLADIKASVPGSPAHQENVQGAIQALRQLTPAALAAVSATHGSGETCAGVLRRLGRT